MYKNLHNDTKQHSWRLFNGTQRNRVDYFLVSEHLGLDIAGADIMPAYCSDHSLVYIRFKSNIVKRHNPALEIQELPSSRYSIRKPDKACDSEFGGNKKYASM